MKLFDTIAAVSTPRGKGGVALIRISGEEALAVAERVFHPRSSRTLESETGRMLYGTIWEKDETGRESLLDDGMAVYFRAPHSFTGEDTVEITCHGGILVTSRVLSAVLTAGARQAEAGEFTRRAFLSGKLALSEAKALGDLLEAKTASQLSLARGGMNGALARESERIYDALRRLLGSTYARIDFPEEDLGEFTAEELLAGAKDILTSLRSLCATYRTGRAVQEGIPTVLCGPTNAGKSSIYNRLLGYDAAIVTDVAGTTRDVLRETLSVGKTTLLLYDTAGLRETDDTVESIGIRRTREAMEKAELILAVFDASRAPTEEERELARTVRDLPATAIALLNKSDTTADLHGEFLREYFDTVLPVSAKTGEGFESLAKAIDRLFIDEALSLTEDAVVTDARQYASLLTATEATARAVHAMENGVSQDLCCIDLEEAMGALALLDGREIGEEIVSEIFSKFCVGK